MSSSAPNPYLLAAVTPEPDPQLLPLLREKPALASAQDNHGYSLLHAAASYSHAELLRLLVLEFHVDVDLLDEDGETCLFVAEDPGIAKLLVEELKVNVKAQNADGLTAAQKIEQDEEWPEVAAYLQQVHGQDAGSGNVDSESSQSGVLAATRPPPLPPNVQMNIRTAAESELTGAETGEPDPEFRRRVEDLAARDDFHTDEGQQELRSIISDAIKSTATETMPESKRRG